MIVIINPKTSGALSIEKKLIPEDLKTLISLSSESLPNVASVANNIAIGIERAIIHARLRNKYSKIINMSNPLPRKRSIALSRKFTNKMNVIISNETKNG